MVSGSTKVSGLAKIIQWHDQTASLHGGRSGLENSMLKYESNVRPHPQVALKMGRSQSVVQLQAKRTIVDFLNCLEFTGEEAKISLLAAPAQRQAGNVRPELVQRGASGGLPALLSLSEQAPASCSAPGSLRRCVSVWSLITSSTGASTRAVRAIEEHITWNWQLHSSSVVFSASGVRGIILSTALIGVSSLFRHPRHRTWGKFNGDTMRTELQPALLAKCQKLLIRVVFPTGADYPPIKREILAISVETKLLRKRHHMRGEKARLLPWVEQYVSLRDIIQPTVVWVCLHRHTPPHSNGGLHIRLHSDSTFASTKTPQPLRLHIRLHSDSTFASTQTPHSPPLRLHIRLHSDSTFASTQTPHSPPLRLHIRLHSDSTSSPFTLYIYIAPLHRTAMEY
ncbi:hypothetical protein EGW08_011761 [Elysia chlorotica]|uniref:Uncharacterized protein n=1 Tax=Elysia chlorotica TaxID=188477 RepID=A0A433TFX4_ELYCH|nr:hypothetical protein EGW08_011761 [Elysia chlorotica]